MSEHYDFHYQPTGSGAISGQQVLEQTEDAINELGDYVNDNIGGAMDVAQQALETAQNAEQDAQTALDTANSFSDAIQSAQQDASTALSTAQTAQTTATNANNTAIQAQQDASSAVTTANNASGQVSTLSGTVTALSQRVTTAEGNIGQNTSDITALGQRVTTAEGNITTLQNDVTIAQGNASSAMATAGQVKQQAYVFRYSSTALTASSTNSNALLDNTDNLKVGDKVIDSSGVLFSITAIDTQNSTFTIGTALVDLAQDSDVVHKSGNETVGGVKTFSNNPVIGNNNTNITISNRQVTANGFSSAPTGSSYSFMQLKAIVNYADSSPSIDATVGLSVQENAYSDGKRAGFNPNSNNTINLGLSGKRWANVYATNYYYGGSEIEFSQKFVTTDTAQTISGEKIFSSRPLIYNSNATVQADVPNLVFKNPLAERASTTLDGEQTILFTDKNNSNIASIQAKTYTSGTSDIILTSYSETSEQAVRTTGIVIRRTPTTSKLHGYSDNITSLGDINRRWSKVYAMDYYYGNDNVEFSTKFVTTDTNQTISGAKTFSDNLTIYNKDSSQATKNLNISSSKIQVGDTSNNDSFGIRFNAGASYVATIFANKDTSGTQNLQFSVRTKDSSDNYIGAMIRLRSYANGYSTFEPDVNTSVSLGSSSNKWDKINGVEPSSLSLPSTTGTIDISSYITDLTGESVNYYTPSANGYIVITCNSSDVDYIKMSNNLNFVSVIDNTNNQFTTGILGVWQPCVAGKGVQIRIKSNALITARFYPCQGNV